jgi:hypothetical protein
MTGTSSRERLLAAIDGAPGAPVPCAFMMFRALHNHCRDEREFALRQIEMGLDATVRVDDLPLRFAPEVEVRDRIEHDGAPALARLGRTYKTPAGELTAVVKLTEDWPYGERLPLFSDYITPRALKFLVTGPEDLAPLRYLLMPSSNEDTEAFLSAAAEQRGFAGQQGLLLSGGWRPERMVPGEDRALAGENFGTGTAIDMLMWLCGATEPLLWAYDQPRFLADLISVIGAWNRRRIEIHLEAGVELVVRRAWYEGTDFWSPPFYRQFILPGLKREAEMVHQAGARFGYILTSGMTALADQIPESGVDVIIGIDPGEGKGTGLEQVKAAFGGRIGLWGGVCGPFAVEQGSEEQVQQAVRDAMDTLAPTGRFVLSPVDNIRTSDERTWRNVRILIDTWRDLARQA